MGNYLSLAAHPEEMPNLSFLHWIPPQTPIGPVALLLSLSAFELHQAGWLCVAAAAGQRAAALARWAPRPTLRRKG